MPELPEVETTRRGITPLIGCSIERVDVVTPKLRWPIPVAIKKLKQERIIAIGRRGKYLLLNVSSGTIIIHLGMSGHLRIVPENIPRAKHDHVDFCLSNGSRLRYTDPRKFGAILWTTEEPEVFPLLENLGPEPLGEEFTTQSLWQSLSGSKRSIKQLIMDNQYVVGVGNIYANEALFLSKISPFRLGGTLKKNECQRLVQAIKKVLTQAIEKGGTTLRNFYSPEFKPGYFRLVLSVYGREGEPCVKCSNEVQRVRLGQRSTFFCCICQQ